MYFVFKVLIALSVVYSALVAKLVVQADLSVISQGKATHNYLLLNGSI